MNAREQILFMWAGSWLTLTWGTYFVVVVHRAFRRRVYDRSSMPETSLALNIRGKNREELLRTKQLLETEITSIRTQLDRARGESREMGRFAKVVWWCKIHQALRIKGRQCQQIQLELGRMRKARQLSVEGHFLDVARERMDPEKFETYLETARRRALKTSREA